jgi:hypothetical protein
MGMYTLNIKGFCLKNADMPIVLNGSIETLKAAVSKMYTGP